MQRAWSLTDSDESDASLKHEDLLFRSWWHKVPIVMWYDLSFHAEHIIPMLPMFMLVLASEMVVDWIKHAFITKFNDISPDVYRRYRAILSKDLATSHHGNVSGV